MPHLFIVPRFACGAAGRLAGRAGATGAVLCALLAAALAIANDVRRQSAPPEGLRSNVPQVFALIGADVVVRPGEVIEDATLVIRDGKIIAVGKDMDVPADAEPIDLAGKRIYAGFIDSWAELPAEQSQKDPALAELTSANYWNKNVIPQIDAARILAVDAKQHEALRKAGFVARLYAPSAGVIKGTAALVSTGEGVQGDAAVLVSPVGMAAQVSSGQGFSRGSGYPASPMGAFALVRQALYDAQWYEQARQAVAANPSLPLPERNDALAALQPVLRGEMPIFFENLDELYALRSDKVAREFDLKPILIGSGYEYRRAGLIGETKRPMILPLSFPKPPDVTTPEQADAATLETLLHWDLAPSNPQRVVELGVPVAFSTADLKKIETEFHANLKKAIVRGLEPEAALAALTTDAAQMLGAADRLGTIEPGKIASFVVVDGDLFAEKSEARILETWVDGKRHRIVRDPVVDFRGTWKVEAKEPVELKINGKPEKLAGEIRRGSGSLAADPATQSATQPVTVTTSRPDSKAAAATSQPTALKLKNLRQSADRLTFTADAEPFGQEGVALVSLTNINGELTGTAVLPDGARLQLKATRTAGPTTEPTTRPDAVEAAVPTEQVAEVMAAEGEPTEVQTTPEGEYAGGTTRTVPPDGGEPEGEAEIETTPTTGPTTVAAAEEENAPLFEPNYPLGAFGRATPEAPDRPRTVMIHGATIWTAGSAGTIENGAVVISEGKIAQVIDARQAQALRKAWSLTQWMPGQEPVVIDANRKHISPGIIDAHSHIASDSGINEGTQAVTAEVRMQDFVNPDDINIYRQLAGGTTTSNTLHGSANPIGGQNVVIKFRWGQGPEQMIMQEAPPGVKFALGENVKQSNWSNPTGRYPQSRMGVPEIIADSFRAAQDYLRAKKDFEQNGGPPVRHDLELEALVEMLSGERLIHAHSYRSDEILALLRVLEEFDIQIGSLQHILEGYKVAKEMAEHGATASTFSDWWAFKFEVYDAIPYNGAIMHNAGVNVSFNSDDAELARRLNTEAAKAIKYGGVPEEEALKFVTINPAKQLRIDQYVGSLEPGKHADLVIWNGAPLSTKSRVEQTWIDGRKYFDREEDLKARDKVREMRAALIQRILASGEKPAAPGETPVRPSALWPSEDIYCSHSGHDHQ